MSAAFKLAKKKYTQQDLRRLMSETKAGSAKQQQSEGAGSATSVKKIDSPLAKYTESGQLTCALCRSVVRSEAVWKVHVNSKQHKENIEQAKKLKEQVKSQPVPKSEPPPVAPVSSFKRPSSPREVSGATKKVKGILKNSTAPPPTNDEGGTLPADFFDTGVKIKRDLVNIRLPSRAGVTTNNEDKEQPAAEAAPPEEEEEKLPEGFFDDPKADAKARNIEYKDPNDEEWERFQRVIKEATTESMAIINEEQEESSYERQISEIDEQIRNWSRVLSLERKKDEVRQRTASAMAAGEKRILEGSAAVKTEIKKEDSDDDDDGDDGEFEEFPDWRAKKSFK